MNLQNKSNKLIVRPIFIIAVALSVLLAALAISCTQKDAANSDKMDGTKTALDTIFESGTIRVGTTGDWTPISFVDPASGEYTGRDVELVEALAKDMGVKVEFVKTDWKNLVSGIAANRYDITTGASYNTGRAKVAGYTMPIGEVYTVAVMQKELTKHYKTWQELNDSDLTAAVSLGTIFDETIQALFPKAKVKKIEAPARDYQEVIAKKADFSLTSHIEASQLKKDYPNNLDILSTPLPNTTPLGLLTPRGDQELINYINTWILLKEKSGFFDELNKKWLPQ